MIDWSQCDLLEVIPGKVSGQPIFKGTRVPAEAVWSNFTAGSPLEEVAENYPSVSLEKIEMLLAYAERQQMRATS